MTATEELLDHINRRTRVGIKQLTGPFIIFRLAVTDNYLWLEGPNKFLVLVHVKDIKIWDGMSGSNDLFDADPDPEADDTDLEFPPPHKEETPVIKPFSREFKELKLEAISMENIKLRKPPTTLSRYYHDYD